jgi:hypothetical protein
VETAKKGGCLEDHLGIKNMKYIGFKHQRENKQNSDKCAYLLESSETNITIWRQEYLQNCYI